MSIERRHNVNISGRGKIDMVFAHGYGCDQNMWRLLRPAFEEQYRVISYDLMGSGRSEVAHYQPEKYASLQGHATDLLDLLSAVAVGPCVFVGHSVSAMIGLLAGIGRADAFASQIMIGPSPCYVNEGDYIGGFTRADIDSLLDTLDSNYLGWASAIAPAIMGAPDRPELGQELTNSFCQADPEIAKHFARTTFLSDNRADVPLLQVRSLILQCTDDFIAPKSVGEYLARTLSSGVLRYIPNIGHCPHLSAPRAIAEAIEEFLAS